jgi:hypothetical protein
MATYIEQASYAVMTDFCDIMKAVLPPDNKMWTWKHIQNLTDQMGDWRVGKDYIRLPLCGTCRLHIFAEDDHTTLCPKCNPPDGTGEPVN